MSLTLVTLGHLNAFAVKDRLDQGPVPRSSLRGLAGYVELQAWVSCTTKVDLF